MNDNLEKPLTMTRESKRNRGKPGGAMLDAHDLALIKARSQAVCRVNIGYSKGILKEPGIHFEKIRVENTNACKYTCEMCPREKMTRRLGIMPPRDYQLVLDRIKEYVEETRLPRPFVSNFFLHGYGEPLLDPMLAVKAPWPPNSFRPP